MSDCEEWTKGFACAGVCVCVEEGRLEEGERNKQINEGLSEVETQWRVLMCRSEDVIIIKSRDVCAH